jgi:hypothetical protein
MTCTDSIDALLMNTKIKFLLSCRRSVVLLLVQAAAQTSCYVLEARSAIPTLEGVLRDLPRFRSIDIIVYQSSLSHSPLANYRYVARKWDA